MDGVPESGQWFRIRIGQQRWNAVFRAIRKYTKGDTTRLLANAYSPEYGGRPVDIPVARYNQFEIVTDPEEEALLALAYM